MDGRHESCGLQASAGGGMAGWIEGTARGYCASVLKGRQCDSWIHDT